MLTVYYVILGDMQLLYIDIETTGLDIETDKITVIAAVVVDTNKPNMDQTVNLNLCVARKQGSGKEEEMKKDLYELLVACDVIIAYNGINFDIPFLIRMIERGDILDNILRKTLDFCSISARIMGVRQSMAQMCVENKITVCKYATGKKAIEWAEKENWAELEYYCMQDVEVMKQLSEKCFKDGLVLRQLAVNVNSILVSENTDRSVIIFFDNDLQPIIPAYI